MHLAFHLLQFKSKWVHEATVDSDVMISPRVAQQGQIRMASSSSLTSGISTSSSLNDELLDVFEGWETLNSALIRNMIRKVATWLENGGGDEPYEAYVQKLRDTAQAGDHHAEEDNTLLITALGIAYDDRKKRREQRGEMRSVSGGSVDRAWREAAGGDVTANWMGDEIDMILVDLDFYPWAFQFSKRSLFFLIYHYSCQYLG